MRFSIWPSPSRSWMRLTNSRRIASRPAGTPCTSPTTSCPMAPARRHSTGTSWSAGRSWRRWPPRSRGVRLAPLVTSVTYRHPAVLANIAAAVDQVSRGRLTLGIGAGWQENEHAAYGIALGTVRERMDRFEEATQIVRSLLDQSRTTFSGQYFQLQDAPNQPAPVQARVPLLIGGGGERRTLRIAARYADHWNAWTTPELLTHKLSVLRAHCEQVGRDPAQNPCLHPGGGVPVDRRGMAEGQAGGPARPAGDRRNPRRGGGHRRPVSGGRCRTSSSSRTSTGSLTRAKDTCDLFMREVAPAFR